MGDGNSPNVQAHSEQLFKLMTSVFMMPRLKSEYHGVDNRPELNVVRKSPERQMGIDRVKCRRENSASLSENICSVKLVNFVPSPLQSFVHQPFILFSSFVVRSAIKFICISE